MAERMFYFLEATEAEPLCRSCLGEEGGPLLLPRAPPALAPPTPVKPTFAAPEPAPPSDGLEVVLLDAIRFFISEELRRSGLTIARLPSDEARVGAARDLHAETQRLLQADRIREALESLRDLRTTVHTVETSGVGGDEPTAGSSEESTIEELYDRVVFRARVLSAQSRADVDANLDALAWLDRIEHATGTESGNRVASESIEELLQVPRPGPRRGSRT